MPFDLTIYFGYYVHLHF